MHLLWPFDGCVDLQGLAQRLSRSAGPVIWFDSARHHPVTGRWSMLAWDPWLTLTARHDRLELTTSAATQVWRGHPLEALRQILNRYRMPSLPAPHARALGLMGYLHYDMNRWIEPVRPPRGAGPDGPEMLWWGMKHVVVVDHLERRSWLLSVIDPHAPSTMARRQAQEALEQMRAILDAPDDPAASGVEDNRAARTSEAAPLRATSTQREFETMVERALAFIRAGDMYQANVSQRFTGRWSGSSMELYRTLREVNPSPFACWLKAGDQSVVSCSPERLVRVQGGRIDTRPIAGTRPRGATAADDAVNGLELLLSEKERAEHLMLVDLARNDLGRVCATGSVSVNELMTLESYSHVLHIVSDVSGRLRQKTDAVDVIRALFPGGTITGCPKVRCMQILRELEPVSRGLYTGSLGYLGFDGTMDLNITIRTMILNGTNVSFHVGAGIVADSIPEREYRETLAKAQALVTALQVAAEGSRLRAGTSSLEPRASSLER